jgi:hypothetical protein
LPSLIVIVEPPLVGWRDGDVAPRVALHIISPV